MGGERHCQRLRPAVEKVSLLFHLRDANDDNGQSARTQIATMNEKVISISEKAVFLHQISYHKYKHESRQKSRRIKLTYYKS